MPYLQGAGLIVAAAALWILYFDFNRFVRLIFSKLLWISGFTLGFSLDNYPFWQLDAFDLE